MDCGRWLVASRVIMQAANLKIVGTWAAAGAAFNFWLAWLMWGDRGVRTRAKIHGWLGLTPPPLVGALVAPSCDGSPSKE